jgi:hypothetical protein
MGKGFGLVVLSCALTAAIAGGAPRAEDCNRNGLDDERDLAPEVAVGEGLLDLTDLMAILRTLFLGAPAPLCLDAADADGDGRVSVADAISLLLYLFQDGPTPPAPGPSSCGRDPHPPGSPRRLGCESYESCR